MPITWHTKNINIQNYYKIIRRIIILNAHDGTHLSGYKYWKYFKAHWDVHIMPTDRFHEFQEYFGHIKDVEVSDEMAWGITGKHEMFLFVVDTRNPFIIRSNAMPMSHELLHAIYQDKVGTTHITRKFDSPEGKKFTQGASATVIVHDNWYGRQMTERFWISWGLGWIPITYSYIPIWVANQLYKL